jgi:protein SYS1
MTGLGVWTCRWRELRPISFGGAVQDVETGTSNGDVGVGFIQGRRGAGLGGDGVGVYEMVDRTEGV